MAKKAGGKWDTEKRVWFIPFGKIKDTAFEKHIVIKAAIIKPITEIPAKASNVRYISGI